MDGPDNTPRRDSIVAAFRKQISWCHNLGSPFTARVLERLAANITAGGDAARLLDAWPGDPAADALALRLAGALHALVLSDAAPNLAACYATAGGDAAALTAALHEALATQQDFLRDFITSPPQTNEVGRSAVLLGGFLCIAEVFGLPLRLLELGASAGLNLIWDRYRYDIAGTAWGDPASQLLLAPIWQGALPPLTAKLQVAARHGCDIAPIDLADAAQRLRLRAYIWADQSARLSRLDRAIAMALAAGYRVAQADAADWLAARLREPADGQATVIYHSIMWQYMPEATRAALTASIQHAANRATPSAPLAWLRFEPATERPDLRLTLWPGAQEHRLAIAQPHGNKVEWFGLP